MSFVKKTIVLSNKSVGFEGLGVVTIEKTSSGVFGNLKTFNINKDNLLLGISVNKKEVIKQTINLNKSNSYSFKLGNMDVGNVSCLLALNLPDKVVPVVWGKCSEEEKTNILNFLNKDKREAKTITKTFKEDFLKENPVNEELKPVKEENPKNKFRDYEEFVDEKNENFSSNAVEEKEKKLSPSEMFEMPTSEELESLINENLNKALKELFKYSSKDDIEILRKRFGECNEVKNNDAINSKENLFLKPIKNEFQQEESPNFYSMISDQIEDLFKRFPVEPNMEKTIPNSKWIKVDFENDGNEYILGLLNDGDKLKHIAYGVPGKFSSSPPAEMEPYAQFIPKNIADPYGDGYWVMYQDADTGESIELNFA